jgi:hypothetical protein
MRSETLTPLGGGAQILVFLLCPVLTERKGKTVLNSRTATSAGRRCAILALALVIVPVFSVYSASAETLNAYLVPADHPGVGITFEKSGNWDYARLSGVAGSADRPIGTPFTIESPGGSIKLNGGDHAGYQYLTIDKSSYKKWVYYDSFADPWNTPGKVDTPGEIYGLVISAGTVYKACLTYDKFEGWVRADLIGRYDFCATRWTLVPV